ncbi:MAG: 6,7-dimethyl-8-ribityllumazine synthase [Chloroflexi bacterium]|nr:6,7-dimethyl-8-ribityllumazine synthase [Chloroflexota bacterium]|tara:strand:+ start:5348 stop:5818 length:471 start_codon:yes stop_codon:yes gene_type:complete
MAEKVILDNFFENDLLDGSSLNIGLAVSVFNYEITNKMYNHAYDSLVEHKVDKNNIKRVDVPGAFELPLICKKMAESNKYDSIIAIGVVIKGDTDHYEFVANNASNGIAKSALTTGIPIIFGILTTDNYKQATDRIIDAKYYATSSIIVPNIIKKL